MSTYCYYSGITSSMKGSNKHMNKLFIEKTLDSLVVQ